MLHGRKFEHKDSYLGLFRRVMISNIPSIRTGGLSLETVSLLPWIVDLMKVPGQKEWEHRLRWHLGLCVSVVNVQNRVKNVAWC